MNRVFHTIEPIVFDDSEVLILGSFPSLKSFEASFYYAHPKNQFWRLLSDIYEAEAKTKEKRIEILKGAKMALWDIVASCERTNSADSNLKSVAPNDIVELLAKHPNIKRIFFTGRTAQKIFNLYFKHLDIHTALLPSPSPAYASMKYEDKLLVWKSILR